MEVAARTICLLCGLIAATALAACDNSSNAAPPAIPTVVTLDGFGNPLAGILRAAASGNTQDLQIFANGQQVFTLVHTLPKLGPLFDSRSCAACHFQPAQGGSAEFIQEVRVRSTGLVAQVFATDNILRLGPQLQGDTEIFGSGVLATPLGGQITSPGCQLSPCQKEEEASTGFAPSLPFCDPTSASFLSGANCTAERQPLPLFGDGLVEAVADQTLIDLAASEPASIRGTVSMVTEFGRPRAARFGWKAEFASMRLFAAASYLIEIGITNLDDPKPFSTCNVGQKQFGVLLNGDDDPKDRPDANGRANMDRFTDFIRALAPPPRLTEDASAQRGQALFGQLGCAGCHTPQLTSAPDPASFIAPTSGGVPITSTLNAILSHQTFSPYSDFLLHDMDSLGDGITAGEAGPTMMRTPPLWGVRAKSLLLHDGRAPDLPTAIILHDGQGKPAAIMFQNLSSSEQQDLINFLDTL
jgi:hypothetical protein